MSTAAVPVAAAPAKGKKKLIIIAVVVLLLVVAGVAAMMLMKKKGADAEGEDAAPAAAEVKHDAHAAPTFVPLDPFTVNLADREAERYAQIGITLEVDDPHLADQIKLFMPAIRNNILLVIADRKAAELMDRDGKAKLAEDIRKETSRALGFVVEDADEPAADAAEGAKKAKKKKKKAPEEPPIKAVQFSNFIIQ
jgi:flagellar FliL protein